MFPKSRGVDDMTQLHWNGGFNDTAGIAFSGLQNDEKLLIGSNVFFSQECHDA
jgi:hypothetical protein